MTRDEIVEQLNICKSRNPDIEVKLICKNGQIQSLCELALRGLAADGLVKALEQIERNESNEAKARGEPIRFSGRTARHALAAFEKEAEK